MKQIAILCVRYNARIVGYSISLMSHPFNFLQENSGKFFASHLDSFLASPKTKNLFCASIF